MAARSAGAWALACAAILAGCLSASSPPPERPPDRVLADSVAVGNLSRVAVPLEAGGPGEWLVQVRVLVGSPVVFSLASAEDAAPADRLGPNVEGRLRGAFPGPGAVLVVDNAGQGPPPFEPGGGVVVSYRALHWRTQGDTSLGL